MGHNTTLKLHHRPFPMGWLNSHLLSPPPLSLSSFPPSKQTCIYCDYLILPGARTHTQTAIKLILALFDESKTTGRPRALLSRQQQQATLHKYHLRISLFPIPPLRQKGIKQHKQPLKKLPDEGAKHRLGGSQWASRILLISSISLFVLFSSSSSLGRLFSCFSCFPLIRFWQMY